jgi:hypothetical protein
LRRLVAIDGFEEKAEMQVSKAGALSVRLPGYAVQVHDDDSLGGFPLPMSGKYLVIIGKIATP